MSDLWRQMAVARAIATKDLRAEVRGRQGADAQHARCQRTLYSSRARP